jgi:hypothetical protein
MGIYTKDDYKWRQHRDVKKFPEGCVTLQELLRPFSFGLLSCVRRSFERGVISSGIITDHLVILPHDPMRYVFLDDSRQRAGEVKRELRDRIYAMLSENAKRRLRGDVKAKYDGERATIAGKRFSTFQRSFYNPENFRVNFSV